MQVQIQTLPNQQVRHGRNIVRSIARTLVGSPPKPRNFPPYLKGAIEDFRYGRFPEMAKKLEQFQNATKHWEKPHSEAMLIDLLTGAAYMILVLESGQWRTKRTEFAEGATKHLEAVFKQLPDHHIAKRYRNGQLSNAYFNFEQNLHEYCALAYMCQNKPEDAKRHLALATEKSKLALDMPGLHDFPSRTEQMILKRTRLPNNNAGIYTLYALVNGPLFQQVVGKETD